jgi:hypothetical protein
MMKLFTVTTGLLLFSLTLVMVAQPARFDALSHDFGEMGQNEARTAIFTLVNTGVDVLRLTHPRASCGCTVVLLSRSELQPGDSASIEVEFRSGPAMLGPVNKSVQVGHLVNGKERELATLRVLAEIVGIVRYDPGMLEFRTVLGTELRRTVRLISNSSESIRILETNPTLMMYADSSRGNTYNVDKVVALPFTDVRITPSQEEIPPGGEVELELVFTLKHKGQLNGAVRVVFERSEIRIPVVGVVLRSGP